MHFKCFVLANLKEPVAAEKPQTGLGTAQGSLGSWV